MKHKVKSLTTIAAVLVLAVFLCATAWAAQTKKSKAPVVKNAPQVLSDEQVVTKFRSTYPKLSVTSASKTAIEGIYEVILNNGNMIVYYSPAADSFIVGDLIDKNLQSVTQKRKADMMQAKLKEIPLDKAVMIGNGKHQVIEFTDPDCPYCRKAAEYLKDKDVTKYVFLRPIPQLHPKAAAKAKYILASKDRASAYYDVMSGKLDKDDNLDKQTIGEDAITLFNAQNATADKIGIYSTPTFWIDGKMVAGANFKLMDELLK